MKRLISVKALSNEFMGNDREQFITKGKIYPVKSQNKHLFTIDSDISRQHHFCFDGEAKKWFKFIYSEDDHKSITDLYYSLWNKQINSNNKLREKNSKLRKERSDLIVFLSDTYKSLTEYLDKSEDGNELIEVLACQVYSVLKNGGTKI